MGRVLDAPSAARDGCLAPHGHVTARVALTPSHEESGCVTILPGSHRHGQLPHADRKDPAVMRSRGQTASLAVAARAAVPVIVQPGQFPLHDTLALRASAPDRSGPGPDRPRISDIPARVRHVGPTRRSATLVRGENRDGRFGLEPRPGGGCRGPGGARRQPRPLLDGARIHPGDDAGPSRPAD